MRAAIGQGRGASVLLSAVTYTLALAAAVAAGAAAPFDHPLAVLVVADLAATAVVFAASVLADNSSMYDPYWSLQPAGVTAFYVVTVWPDVGPRGILMTALVALYALRLTSNFYRDWPGLTKEDFRYVGFRRRSARLYWPLSLLGIHLMPTLVVFLGCLPLYAVYAPGDGASLGWLDGVAAAVTLGSVLIAFVADEQLRHFRRRPANAGQCIRTGLWAHSRHPNYLGEILTWWGLYLFALAAGAGWWWTGAGAAAVTLLFVTVSVPLMEARALATRSGYPEYASRTPMLLPLGRCRVRDAGPRES